MMQKNKRNRNESGFTLLEILGVLTLLAAIIALVTPNVIQQTKKGQIKVAQAQISSLKAVLNSYYLDNSAFPTTEQGLKALYEKPTLPPVPINWSGPYLEEKKVPKDPWGREIKYTCPGQHNRDKYDIYTLGSDNTEGGTGTNADIGNW